MIFIDGNNTLRRVFHVSMGTTMSTFMKDFKEGIRKIPDKKELYELQYMTLFYFINDLLDLKTRYKNYGELVITFDGPRSWRKELYPRYKEGRNRRRTPEKVIEGKLFSFIQTQAETLLEYTRFIIIKGSDIHIRNDFFPEADDAIGTLVLAFPGLKHLIASTDSDFKQLCNNPNVRRYHPIKKVLLENPSKKDIELWKICNLIGGQGKDSIPPITHFNKLSKEFITWVNEKHDLEIDGTMMEFIEQEHPDLIKKYEKEMSEIDEEEIKKGKRKKRRYLTAYDNKKFGDMAAMKFHADFEKNMEINPRYKENYKRNELLLLFDHIPEFVKDPIISEFQKQREKSSKFFNTIPLQTKLTELKLYKLEERLSEF